MKKMIISTMMFLTLVSQAQLKTDQPTFPPPNEPHLPVTETIRLTSSFYGSECFSSRNGDLCGVIMVPQLKNITIDIEESQFSCSNNSSTDNSQTCLPTQRQGDWLQSIYLDNQRYIGIITIQKFMIPETQAAVFYQAIVEILGKNKTLARMSTTFYDVNQIPHATLEAPEIIQDRLGGTVVTRLQLHIAPPRTFDLPPLSPGEELKKPHVLSKKQQFKASSLPKVQWKVEKGNVILK